MATYAADYRGLLPDGGHGPGVGSNDQTMAGLGGYFDTTIDPHPRGLGLLWGMGYLSTEKMFYCPSASGEYARMKPNRLRDSGFTSGSDFYSKITNATVTSNNGTYAGYLFRGVRYHRDWPAWRPAVEPVASAYDRYLYSLEVMPPGAPGTLAFLSDDWSSRLNNWDPQGRFYHVEGYNVAYTDGHGSWVGDPDRLIDARGDASNGGYSSFHLLNGATEDVWDAFDGDIGNAAFNFVFGLM